MKKSTFKVNYLLRKDKVLKNGEVPINIRITLNGERATFNSKYNVKPEIWNQKSNRAKGTTAYASSINKYLDNVYIKLCDSLRDLEERGFEVTAENIKNNYLGFMEHRQVTVLNLYQEHNDKMKSLVGKGYAYSSLEKHYSTIGHLKGFLKWKYKANDLNIERVDYNFVSEFQFYLKSEKNISHNTSIKYLRNFGKVVRIAINANYLKQNPFAAMRLCYDEIERPFLDITELQKLIQFQPQVRRLEQIKDIFLFCCLTGLAFVDTKTLTEDCLFTSPTGEIWIKKQRQKTKKWSHIPLLPQAKFLLDKYENHSIREKGYLLPVPTNQKMNAYLKEIADLCGINKNLTTHLARHTFATLQLTHGTDIYTVSKMLGHADVKTTQIYAQIVDEKKQAAANAIKLNINNN